ncbi:hypothetical protein [Inquilinus sp. Marseille-Q2685]|uniref:hypothetical protein n=1 Tax=Inquilinus sp. Marseille-Q2685 TaxID=2866581 RepID=UPI001CE43F83|nr:hypothetical protein [Inquilinus sp. Marseille-Q2685]
MLTLYTRSFHPDEAFGLGGLGFKGDNRGFSSSLSATSRIDHFIEIDLMAAQFRRAICRSDPSANWALAQVGIDMSNDYSQARKKPRHSEDPKSITPYRVDGDQSVNVRVKYAGKNFAFFLSDTDLGHGFFGGQVSDGGRDTNSGSFIPFGVQSPVTRGDDGSLQLRSPVTVEDRWSGVVPDLDVTNEVMLRINRVDRKATVTCSVSGDGFPNCESFLIDGSGNVLFLASHVRIGTAATQLPNGRAVAMFRTMLEVEWTPDDSFGNRVSVHFAHDYTGTGTPNVLASGAMDRAAWNAVHTGRDASGPLSRQVRDNIPLPESEYLDGAINWTGRNVGEAAEWIGRRLGL